MHDAVTGLVSGVTCFPKNSVKIAQAKDAHLRDMDQLEGVEDLANRVGLLYRQVVDFTLACCQQIVFINHQADLFFRFSV